MFSDPKDQVAFFLAARAAAKDLDLYLLHRSAYNFVLAPYLFELALIFFV